MSYDSSKPAPELMAYRSFSRNVFLDLNRGVINENHHMATMDKLINRELQQIETRRRCG
jgi:hypothetical protein